MFADAGLGTLDGGGGTDVTGANEAEDGDELDKEGLDVLTEDEAANVVEEKGLVGEVVLGAGVDEERWDEIDPSCWLQLFPVRVVPLPNP